jgi:sec-independent protein translocase protein TatA
MPNLGFGELMIVLLIVVVVFGSTKLPQLGDGLGRAIKNFKRAVGSNNEIDVSPRKGELKEGEGQANLSGSDKSTAKMNG